MSDHDDEAASGSDSELQSPLEEVRAKHRKEIKAMQSQVQALKKSVPKGDNKRKKDVQKQIEELEAETAQRHATELKAAEAEEAKAAAAAAAATANKPNGAGSGGSELAAATSEEAEAHDAADDSSSNKTSKPTRAQKRRDNKATAHSERMQRAEAEYQATAARGPSARDVEANQLKQALQKADLAIKTITSDGHCLYNAVADQLRRNAVARAPTDFAALRKLTASFILAHQDDFLPFLVTDSGDMYTETELKKYCNEIASTAAWGGQIEAQALSAGLQVPIHIYQAGSPVVTLGADFPGEPLRLSYHRHLYGLGEHYNSLVPSSSPDADASSS
ncbi:OTU domain-containing protein 6B [Capsaspora owczarzaki ATCC 30864]|uniref:OTU domain-containing protein 6B n=1 Tax=Capsaspora owczarzaki (strain ATCC 30864) TaxID=595528 RepID=A0A0D2X565_CAPO3|nr:OTU domain-containing protein 6B [Capsaspora owczarzaki ATCC 30864]KJE97269.1 OTU domain-containing protein 6B [Capsaspora owczarzaki ATCC 30864]|eukprot:XP_004343579.1 OTU domain-containing protein 6B [Capsaspora owczarzaki ATCC 30864]